MGKVQLTEFRQGSRKSKSLSAFQEGIHVDGTKCIFNNHSNWNPLQNPLVREAFRKDSFSDQKSRGKMAKFTS
jgi:hypothetical protein